MKKQFISTLAFLSITLTACSNNYKDTMDSSKQEQQSSMMDSSKQKQKSSEPKSGEYAEIGSGAHLVEFPKDLEKGIIFNTFDRGNIHENIYVNSKEAIEAVQNGKELPSGTVITLEGYKDGELEHFLVMEKRTGWGSQYSPKERIGEWELQAFTPDREVMKDGIGGPAIGRCYTCHANRERDEYMNSYNAMKKFDLGKVAQSKNSSTKNQIAAIPTEDWKVSEIPAHLNGSKNVSNEESRLIGEEEKTGLLQDVLLNMYLNQYKS